MPKEGGNKLFRKVEEFLGKTLKGPQQMEEGSQFLKGLEHEVSKPTKLLAINSLTISDVLDIFGLTFDPHGEEVWALSDKEMLDIPEDLYAALDKTARSMDRDPHNEAASRMRLNHILDDVVTQEQLHASTINRRGIPISPICLTPEASLSLGVTLKGEERLLNGTTSYSIRYDQGLHDTHLVVVEAKRSGMASDGIAQCLAYMAIVRRTREIHGRDNVAVYGCASDSHHFAFLRIDQEGKYSICHQEWGRRVMAYLHRSERRIYTRLRLMTRMATLSSPRTSSADLHATAWLSDSWPYHRKLSSDQEMA